MEWMDELEKAVRRSPEQDEEQDGEIEEGCDMEKSVKPDYEPSDNGDDEDADPETSDKDALDNANQRTGKKQNLYPKNRNSVKKSLADSVEGDVADAIDASEVLEGLVKSIDALAAGQDAEVAELRAEVKTLSKGLEVIGKALVKSLQASNDIAKSLSGQIDEMGRQPAGRKSQVRKIEKSFAGGNDTPELPSKAERMEKSMAAVKAGKITPVDASVFETCANRGQFRLDLWRKMGGE